MKRTISKRGERGASVLVPEHFCRKLGLVAGDRMTANTVGAKLCYIKSGVLNGYKLTSAGKPRGLLLTVPMTWLNATFTGQPYTVDIDTESGALTLEKWGD